MISNSKAMETRLAVRLKAIFGMGRAQPGSGNQAQSPNDVAVPSELHIECKETMAKSMIVHHSWIKKAEKLALTHSVPAFLAIQFSREDIRAFFLIPEEDFYEYMELKRANR